jgi:sugar/nucleoside kinase (ribokinase family)
MGIVVFGAVLVDIKGFPNGKYVTHGRNAGRVTEVHGGVSRNVVEDIANVELRPTFVSVVDHSALSQEIIDKLKRHKVNTKYIRKTEGGLGKWLAVFNNEGDVVASISQRPDLSGIGETLKKYGDEIISEADSVAVEIDMDSDLLNQIFDLCEKHHKKIFAVVSNMSIAMERRDLMTRTDCIVCNQSEASLLFSEDYKDEKPMALARKVSEKIHKAKYPKMVVTLGDKGAVYAQMDGDFGVCPAQNVEVVDAAGCGDAFFAGVTIGLTYGKSLSESCAIGTRLASSVIATTESVSPRFRPEEFNLDLPEELQKTIANTES